MLPSNYSVVRNEFPSEPKRCDVPTTQRCDIEDATPIVLEQGKPTEIATAIANWLTKNCLPKALHPDFWGSFSKELEAQLPGFPDAYPITKLGNVKSVTPESIISRCCPGKAPESPRQYLAYLVKWILTAVKIMYPKRSDAKKIIEMGIREATIPLQPWAWGLLR
jgi:hypothetical protein